jgi:hypothetical protein
MPEKMRYHTLDRVISGARLSAEGAFASHEWVPPTSTWKLQDIMITMEPPWMHSGMERCFLTRLQERKKAKLLQPELEPDKKTGK